MTRRVPLAGLEGVVGIVGEGIAVVAASLPVAGFLMRAGAFATDGRISDPIGIAGSVSFQELAITGFSHLGVVVVFLIAYVGTLASATPVFRRRLRVPTAGDDVLADSDKLRLHLARLDRRLRILRVALWLTGAVVATYLIVAALLLPFPGFILIGVVGALAGITASEIGMAYAKPAVSNGFGATTRVLVRVLAISLVLGTYGAATFDIVADDYVMSSTVPIPSGTYARLGYRGSAVVLAPCAGGPLVAIAEDSIVSTTLISQRFPSRPSVLDALTGTSTLAIGLRLLCP